MILALRYGDLSGTISETNKLANELGQYCDDLSKKVQQKMYSVDGGMSSALNNADYYVKAKITQLRARENDAKALSAVNQALLDTAKRVDSDVEKTIQANQKAFFQKNSDLKAPWYQRAFTSLMCDLKNVPAIGWLIKSADQITSAIDTLSKEIRYWYKCEGGKELVGIALSVIGVTLAVILFVCAVILTGGAVTIFALISAIAGAIGALIGAVNAATNVITSFQAYNAAARGQYGRAKIHAGQDKLSDVIRQQNFHNREWNRWSNTGAMALDITETVCAIIALVFGAVGAFNAVKALGKRKIAGTIKVMCRPRNELGRFVKGKPTLWNGIKSISLKFNLKDFILGDLNVKNLSRLSTLPRADTIKAIGDLSKAARGVVDGLDKVNEGKQTITRFMAKRAVLGLDTAVLKTQVLNTKSENGVAVRKFRDTNITKIFKGFRSPIDDLGLTKIMTDITARGLSDTLKMKGGLTKNISDTLNMKGGLIKNISDITKSFNTWKSENDYNQGLAAPSYGAVQSRIPNMDTTYNISVPTFVMPALDFNFNLICKTPYFNS